MIVRHREERWIAGPKGRGTGKEKREVRKGDGDMHGIGRPSGNMSADSNFETVKPKHEYRLRKPELR